MPVRTRSDHPLDKPLRGSPKRSAHRRSGPLATRVKGCVLRLSLEVALLRTLRKRFGVASVLENPEPFEWTDAVDGRDRFHLPLALIRRGPDDLAFVDATPRQALLRDPALAGTRKRIEAECRQRGASYEIWTADEILENRSVTQLVLVADHSERAEYRLAMRDRQASCPPVVGMIADRMFLSDLRDVGSGWVGRSRLTGIPMAILCGLEMDPQTRLLVWRPKAPSTSRRDDATRPVEGSRGTSR